MLTVSVWFTVRRSIQFTKLCSSERESRFPSDRVGEREANEIVIMLVESQRRHRNVPYKDEISMMLLKEGRRFTKSHATTWFRFVLSLSSNERGWWWRRKNQGEKYPWPGWVARKLNSILHASHACKTAFVSLFISHRLRSPFVRSYSFLPTWFYIWIFFFLSFLSRLLPLS